MSGIFFTAIAGVVFIAINRGLLMELKWKLVAIPGLIAIGIALWQSRGGATAEAASVPMAVGLLVMLIAPVPQGPTVRYFAFSDRCCCRDCRSSLLSFSLAENVRATRRQLRNHRHSSRKSRQSLAGLLVGPPDLGPLLLFRTDHRVLAANYHRGSHEVLATHALFTDGIVDEDDPPDYLLHCPNSPLVANWSTEGTLINDLTNGVALPWLVPVLEVDEATLYRIDHANLESSN